MRTLYLLLASGLFLLLVGCSPLAPVKTHPISFYQINTVTPNTQHSKRAQGTLLVNPPLANPGYGTAHMIYIKQPYELNHYAYHRWIAPPTTMLTPLLVQSLESTKRFNAVVAAPYSGQVNWALNITQFVLQQQVMTEPNYVQLSFHFRLLDVQRHQIVAQGDISIKEMTTQTTPYAGVEATNRAVSKALGQLTEKILRSTPPA